QKREHLVPRNPVQPAAKRVPGAVAAELRQGVSGRLEDLLEDVVDIRPLHPALSAPVADQRRIEPKKLPPRPLTAPPRLLQQAERSDVRPPGVAAAAAAGARPRAARTRNARTSVGRSGLRAITSV